MERVKIEPRVDWREKMEALEFDWHTTEDGPYWDESAYWLFSEAEIDELETATDELHRMAHFTVTDIIENQQLPLFGYDPTTIKLIEHSWYNRSHQPTIYGRFDLAYDGINPPKLLEYNGDTPTSLYEAAVIQWQWLMDVFPEGDQFNSMHEKLRDALHKFRLYELGKQRPDGLPKFYTTSVESPEDEGTLNYLRSICDEVIFPSDHIELTQIGWRTGGGPGYPDCFVDLKNEQIKLIFKLVPWEWLINDPFGRSLIEEAIKGNIVVLEPAWKMVVSNKRFLASLWKAFPGHPNLLQASSDPREIASDALVKKPFLGREGANVRIVERGQVIAESEGAYADDQYIYQERAHLAEADGNHAVIGSWVIDGKPAGIGIRESTSLITGNTARFVPHRFE